MAAEKRSSQHRELLARARQRVREGRQDLAEPDLQQIVRADRRNVDALHMLGAIAISRGEATSAAQFVRRALRIRPDEPVLLSQLGTIRQMQGAPADARRMYRKALRHNPNHVDAIIGLTMLEARKRDLERALETITPHAHEQGADPSIVTVAADMLTRLREPGRAIELLHPHLDRDHAPLVRRGLYLALARAHDQRASYDEAITAVEAGNAPLGDAFDPASFERLHEEIVRTFSPSTMKRLGGAGNESRRPVFIVGLPRSGSTLIERILDAHPDIHAGGELPIMPRLISSIPDRLGESPYPACVDEWGESELCTCAADYIDALKRVHARASRVTDKMLTNYLNVGLITLLMPNAAIIHVRRDLRDVAISCLFTLRLQSQPWAVSLESIATAARAYRAVMEHWKALPEVKLHEVHYESLLEQPEAITRAMLDAIDVPWDERCLSYYKSDRLIMTHSYDQASRPMYSSSVGRWSGYANYLEPHREAFQGDESAA